ncbi:MAG TPA: STAS domain-containing protein [Nannocystis sp.]
MHEQLRTAPLVVIDLDEAHVVVAWNDRAERLFATSRDAAVGRPIADLLPLAGSASWPGVLIREDDEPGRIVVVHPTVGERHLEASVQRGGDVAFRIYAHDVTARVPRERRRALDALLVSTISSNLDLVLWAIDREGKFLVHQGKALAAIGLKDNQFIGQNMFELYGGITDTAPIRNAVAGVSHHSAPMEHHGVFFEHWYLAVDDPESRAAAVGISLDVTEAHRRQEELRARLEEIELQREVIRELSTPIIEVWDGVLALPIVGLVDTARTAELMDNLLQTIARTRSRFAVLDLTGVQVVDTSTASHLIGLIQAIRLLGAEGVLTGIHPNIAQTVVTIGVDLSHVRVFATLRDALKYCIQQSA